MTGSDRNIGQPGVTGAAISWRRHTDDTIRSEDSTYWVSQAPVPNRGMVYTAAYRPQDLKRDGAIRRCPPRVCSVSGSPQTTWRAV